MRSSNQALVLAAAVAGRTGRIGAQIKRAKQRVVDQAARDR